MEKIRVVQILSFLTFACSLSCSTGILKYEKNEPLDKNQEFQSVVKIEEVKTDDKKVIVENAPPKKEALILHKDKQVPAPKKEKKSKKTAKVSNKPEPVKVLSRQPDLEDKEGFAPGSRRPLVDPFHEGEIVTHRVSYFKMSAGELKLKVEPFQYVNGRKSYSFATEIKTLSIFNSIYAVDDRAVTYVDYEDLVPRVFNLHVKESGQLREAQAFFDIQKWKATYWETKVTKKSGEEKRKLEWDIEEYAQNVFSAAYYMRLFKWDLGKEYSFRVADDEKNIVFKGTAIRKERISTDAGEFDAIVIKPIITTHGVFTPMGDIYFWLSDDDRKYILKIESEIKIGTIVSEVTKIEPGTP